MRVDLLLREGLAGQSRKARKQRTYIAAGTTAFVALWPIPQLAVVNAKSLKRKERIDTSACALRHLLFADRPMGMCEDLFMERKIERHKECGPVYAMEANDIFANDLHVGRPPTLRASIRTPARAPSLFPSHHHHPSTRVSAFRPLRPLLSMLAMPYAIRRCTQPPSLMRG